MLFHALTTKMNADSGLTDFLENLVAISCIMDVFNVHLYEFIIQQLSHLH